MKPFLPLICALGFTACQKDNPISPVSIADSNVTDSVVTPVYKNSVDPQYLIDSVTVAGKMYKVVQGYPSGKNDLPLRILYEGDTIYRHSTKAYNGFEFEDIDGDGILDIKMNQLSNVGGAFELVMFDAKAQRFKEIKGFYEFTSTEKLPGTKYFYSDHRMGCAGGMWGSELFYIDNFEAKAVARIFIVTCQDADYAQGVTVYKIKGDSETIITQMDEVPEKYIYDYAGFFKEYWSGKYKKFE